MNIRKKYENLDLINEYYEVNNITKQMKNTIEFILKKVKQQPKVDLILAKSGHYKVRLTYSCKSHQQIKIIVAHYYPFCEVNILHINYLLNFNNMDYCDFKATYFNNDKYVVIIIKKLLKFFSRYI